MTKRQSPQEQPYKPDPFEVQIASLVILYRKEFLEHDPKAVAALASLSKDYLDYGRKLEKLSGKPSPFDPHSKEEATPAEVFFENDGFIGHTSMFRSPQLGWR